MESPSKPIWLILAPVAFTLLWAGGYAVAKVGLQYAEPMTLLSMRFGAVLILLLPLYLILRPALPKRPKDWLHLAVVGVLMQAVYFGFCWWAFKTGVSAGVLAIFMSLQPILVAVLAPWLARERVSWKRWLGLLLGLGGVLIVILARSTITPPTLAGIVFSLLGLLGITSGVLYEKRFGISYHPVVSNLVQYGAGLFAVLPIAYFTETMAVKWTGELMAALAYLVIGNSILAISLLLAMIRSGEVARVSSLMFLVPPLAALFGWWLLGEAMPPAAWAGMALAALGVSIAITRTNRRAG
ncbi:DMT family transporter [Aestuariispira insulae]|uniref:Drug/metabolite transporter (DMT)-like permease n=1 Tax=Aestuariispira insulae TaxID=1461337 RepID=A0A3D9HEY1_9PROT|nr:DMT family transporter [Aestuariispira insulae]RED48034.1 drug/metabolite transporter (DMT)-like permease [Aestuariispira insulae]